MTAPDAVTVQIYALLQAKLLIMKPAEKQIKEQSKNFEFAINNITTKEGLMNFTHIKRKSICKAIIKFHGACPGCGRNTLHKTINSSFTEIE